MSFEKFSFFEHNFDNACEENYVIGVPVGRHVKNTKKSLVSMIMYIRVGCEAQTGI